MTQDTLTFFLKMKDMMSGSLVKMGQTAKSTFDKVATYSANVKKKNDILGSSYDSLRNQIRAVENTISKSTSISQIKAARKELDLLQRQASKHAGNSSRSRGGGMLSGAMGGLLPMMGVAGALALGGNMLNAGMQAQARQASFEVIAGKQAGSSLNKDLTKYAQDSIYGNEVHSNAQTMLGFGISDKDVMKNTKMLGDIAMGDANKLQSLTLAFSQVSAAGKLTGQDLLQFINAGFNPLQQMAKDTGKSLSQLKEEVSAGAISFQDVEQAFTNATSAGGMFYGMTDKIAQTDFGKWEAFKGSLDGLMAKIGGGLAPILGSLITNVLEPFVDIISVSIDFIEQYSEWFVILGAGILAYQGYVWLAAAATKGVTAAQWLWNAAMTANPIGLVVAGIAALVVGIMLAWNKFEGFRKVVYGLGDAFKQVFTNIGQFFKQIFSPIFDAINAFKEGRYADAGKAVLKLGYNISPVGFAQQAYKFAADGGFTKGVKDAYNTGSLKGIRSKVATTDVATGGGSGASAGANGSGAGASEAVRGVVSGGPRVININGVKLIETLHMSVGTMDEGMDQLEEKLQNLLLRILNSAAAVQ